MQGKIQILHESKAKIRLDICTKKTFVEYFYWEILRYFEITQLINFSILILKIVHLEHDVSLRNRKAWVSISLKRSIYCKKYYISWVLFLKTGFRSVRSFELPRMMIFLNVFVCDSDINDRL